MNHIDVDYCESVGIKIYSLTKDYELINQLPSTSELAFGLLLDLMRNITLSNNITKENKTWDYLPFVGQQMKDFKVGIVGYGRLGKMMAKYCRAFDAQVYIYDPYSDESNVRKLEDLFQICDAVSLHGKRTGVDGAVSERGRGRRLLLLPERLHPLVHL